MKKEEEVFFNRGDTVNSVKAGVTICLALKEGDEYAFNME